MLSIGNKTFMNLQEAVGWLLENNALPFQSTANYVGNTEIAMSTLINPSPAKVRVGSIIFFADSKVSTVVGVTSNGFIVSDQYNDLVDDVVYVSNVALNASGHLIVTLSNGTDIDAGLIKQVSNFSIDASQHLIATYNDGTTNDLGAIFSGNINISGTLNATAITGDSITENMSGYSFTPSTVSNLTLQFTFVGAVKTGNKITLVLACQMTKTDDLGSNYITFGSIYLPQAVGAKIIPVDIDGGYFVDVKKVNILDTFTGTKEITGYVQKPSDTRLVFGGYASGLNTLLELNKAYYFRYELTILLSDSLAQ